jgi:hypothetical protein
MNRTYRKDKKENKSGEGELGLMKSYMTCVERTTHLFSGGDHPASHHSIRADANGGEFQYGSAMNSPSGARELRWLTYSEVNKMEDEQHVCRW